jgi:hypothetical protein
MNQNQEEKILKNIKELDIFLDSLIDDENERMLLKEGFIKKEFSRKSLESKAYAYVMSKRNN